MNKESLLDKLILQAQKEAHPKVDVADDVLDILALSRQAQLVSYRPLVWIASVSSIAAACIILLTLSLNGATDAMVEFQQAISWVTQ